MEKRKIVVLIPCYNEEKTIVKVIRDFNRVLPDSLIYVYDNNSVDNSYSLASKEKCIVKRCMLQGKGNVVKKMFKDIKADCYLIVDGDDTYSSRYAKKMCNYILNDDVDMVIGDRLSTTYFKENKKKLHGFGNRLVCFLIKILFNYRISDVLSGYRAFSYNFVQGISIVSNNFEVESEMTIKAIREGYVIRSIPTIYKDRRIGSSSKIRTIRDGFLIISFIFKMYFSYHVRLFYNLFSLLFFIIGLFLFIDKNELYLIFFIFSIIVYLFGIVLYNINLRINELFQFINKNHDNSN